jgi:MOSC domain
MEPVPLHELESGLDEIRRSPAGDGTVELIARRPAEGERELLDEAQLDLDEGLVGDRWASTRPDPEDRENQLTLMNSRAAALVAGGPDGWAIAGDQLYVDLALGYDNLPPGTRLRVGSAVIEVTAVPHTGCGKFLRRFGIDAQKLVNSPSGRELNLRGINAKVVTPGTIRRGDAIAKLADR